MPYLAREVQLFLIIIDVMLYFFLYPQAFGDEAVGHLHTGNVSTLLEAVLRRFDGCGYCYGVGAALFVRNR